MAPRKNKSKGKGKKGRKTRAPRLVKGTTQFASLTETYDLGPLDANTGTKVAIAGLVGFPRAQAVARNYGMYRIAKIDLEIKPVFDTYIPGAAPVAGPTSVPYLYWQIVRDGDYPTAPTNLYFEQRGSKPIRLDDKIIKFGWKPNALTDVQGGLGSPNNGNIKMTPWLSADASSGAGWLPNATPHYGVVFAAFCSGVGAYKVMTAVMKVHYQFKQAHTGGRHRRWCSHSRCDACWLYRVFDASGNSLDNPLGSPSHHA